MIVEEKEKRSKRSILVLRCIHPLTSALVHGSELESLFTVHFFHSYVINVRRQKTLMRWPWSGRNLYMVRSLDLVHFCFFFFSLLAVRKRGERKSVKLLYWNWMSINRGPVQLKRIATSTSLQECWGCSFVNVVCHWSKCRQSICLFTLLLVLSFI